ncbi:MAG: YggS family pyridoxal phosphate-dependent enzyme [Candidatus Omnitrophota bacterium]|jgi:hypothetical protein
MIKDNVSRIKAQTPEAVTIVAVSKGRSVSQIQEAIGAGITDIGENRVQEALVKYNAIRDTQYGKRIKWHLVGHLQTNKVKEAVKTFDLIQSVDSLHLALEIDKQAAQINKLQDILIEVNTSGEATKFGLKREDAIGVIKEIGRLKNIKINGLMTVAPIVDNPEETRPYFRKLRELLEEINCQGITPGAPEVLSMGMTDDFRIAIEEGSTMVRLGRAIFR